MVAVCVVGSADTAKCADWIREPLSRWDGELVRHIYADQQFSSAVGATERLLLFPTRLLLDLLSAGPTNNYVTLNYHYLTVLRVTCLRPMAQDDW